MVAIHQSASTTTADFTLYLFSLFHFTFVSAWRSGSGVGRINEFALRRARLIPGWLTVFGGQTTSVCNQPPRPTQLPTLRGTGNEYRPKCGDALRLGSKGRHGSLHLWINVWAAGELCYPSLTRAIPERFRDKLLMIKRYTNLRLLT